MDTVENRILYYIYLSNLIQKPGDRPVCKSVLTNHLNRCYTICSVQAVEGTPDIVSK